MHAFVPPLVLTVQRAHLSFFASALTLFRGLQAVNVSFGHSGDRYLKPWIIPEPEVMLIPRAKEDECLVLASDGLWDVMTNEEACDLARRRILTWHKKNGTGLTSEASDRATGLTDPAAQAAAEYLSKRALQKGSRDNITVIVVDLKAQRRIKSRA